MKVTNHAGLPDPIVRAVSYSERNIGVSDYTITELIQPPRILALKRKHENEITEDASDRIWALMGSAAHEVLRRSAKDTEIAERRFFTGLDGHIISGQIDYNPETAEIYDYKFVSVWSIKEGVKEEWEQQLNCYRYLLFRNGLTPPDSLWIIAILRDWSKLEAKRNSDYPRLGVAKMEVKVWPIEATEAWIRGRIATHEGSKKELPECTPDEMWAKPEKWAVKKKGGVRALRLYDTEAEALAALGKGQEIEHRPSERTRCASYCAVSQFCSQWTTFDKRETTKNRQ